MRKDTKDFFLWPEKDHQSFCVAEFFKYNMDDSMAKNFKIDAHRNDENLHLKLKGDFDGTSAYELLDIVRKRADHTSRVFIHTSNLRDIHPFGLHVFRSNLDILKSQSVELVFTGENASQFESNYAKFS
ncbi:MAG: anti-sigma factor antagonist [Deltaproteobacteria bacterium]|nr:anti-sigma factor antagonist [Deltaproteobacteria bacterium]